MTDATSDKLETALEDAIIATLKASEPKSADVKNAIDYIKAKWERDPARPKMGSGFDTPLRVPVNGGET